MPEAAVYAKDVKSHFTVELWNPTDVAVTTRLAATIALKRGVAFRYSGAASGTVSADQAFTSEIAVPSRKVVKVVFEAR